MPIIKSAKKQLKTSIKHKSRNDHFKDLYRESRKKFEKAIKAADVELAKEVYYNKKDKDWKNIKSWLQSIIDKLEKKNIIHQNNASRKKSNFVKMIKNLEIKAS